MKENHMLMQLRFGLLMAVAALGFWACQVTQSPKIEDTVSFTKLYDSLSGFDSAVIVFKGMNGSVLDTVYKGKVDTLSEIEKLPVENWDGGKVTIEIAGFKDGQEVYKVEKIFDGNTNKSDTTFVILAPGATLTSLISDFRISEGDSIAKPPITVNPASLKNKTLTWTSSHPDILLAGETHLKALKAGTAQVTIALVSNPSKTLVLQVMVTAKAGAPEKITLSPRTLTVAVGGAPARMNVQATPLAANAAVTWRLEDSTLASITAEGWVQGLLKGTTTLWAVSKEKPALIDSAVITVTDPISVEGVSFSKNSVDLFVGGAAESLTVVVLPPGANQAVDFSLVAPGVVSLAGGKIMALATGQALVIAKSRENPSKADTLSVTVLKSNAIDSVAITPENPPPLIIGGADLVLTGNAFPSDAPQLFQWTSSDPAVATVSGGKVTPMSPGTVRIRLVSLADNTKKDSVNVIVEAQPAVIDTVAPKAPVLSGASPTGNPPQWKWTSGGDGSGDFRHKLGGDGNLATGATLTRDTAFTLATAVSGTTYTLHVQERDSAGNWSATSALAIKYDLTKPTVTISSPIASGIHYTTAATVGLSGSTGGPNAIAKVTYSVDGGEPVNAVLGAVGTWSVAPIALATEKAYAIVVTATDALGNSGEAAVSVVKDVTGPTAPSFITTPQSLTKTALGSWSWANGNDGVGGSGLNDKYRYRLNGGIWTNTGVLLVADLILAEGANTFEVQEQDKALNWSESVTSTVKVDTKGPVIAFSTPATTGNTFTSTSSNNLTITGTATDALAGVKSVECEFMNGSTVTNPTVAGTKSWTVSSLLKSGTTTITCVSSDSLSNKGASAFIKVTMNLPKPVLSNLDIPAGTVTSIKNLTVNYKVTVNGVTTDESKEIVLSAGINNIIFTSKATNEVGESGALTVKYVYLSNVIFVNAAGMGKDNGTSWMDGYKSFKAAMKDARVSASSAQVWVAKGNYSDPDYDGVLGSGIQTFLPTTGIILGGFDPSVLPADTASRNLATNHSVLKNHYFKIDQLGSKFEFNGLEFDNSTMNVIGGSVSGSTLNLVNCTVLGLKFPQEYWDISSNTALTMNMIGVKVTNIPVENSNWMLRFYSPGGAFLAKKSSFTRSRSGPSLFWENTVGSPVTSNITFDDCEITAISTESPDIKPTLIEIQNENAVTTIKNSRVRYGVDAISITEPGVLIYQGNTDL